MLEMTKCTNNDCPSGSRCERRTSAPGIRQSVQRFEFVQDEHGIRCEKFRMIDERDYTNFYLMNPVQD